jgi:hypothetical protein
MTARQGSATGAAAAGRALEVDLRAVPPTPAGSAEPGPGDVTVADLSINVRHGTPACDGTPAAQTGAGTFATSAGSSIG